MAESEFLGELIGSGSLFSVVGAFKSLIMILAGLVILGICAGVLWYILKKKKSWNIKKVEILIPRNEGNYLDTKYGKGFFDTEKGVVHIKRKGRKTGIMKPFNTLTYLEGTNNHLRVVEVSPGHYIPILPESYMHLKDDKTGEEVALLKLKSDFSESKSWRNNAERSLKEAYTITNLLKEYAPYISIGLVIFLWGIQFIIMYMKIA